MTTDLDALVLGPCFRAFAKDVTLIAPDLSETPARGILTNKPDINDGDLGAFIAQVRTLGLRASELAEVPAEGWMVRIGTVTYRVPQQPSVDGEGRVEVVLAEV